MTSTTLKLVALFLMLLDHINQFIGGAPLWLTWLGRSAAPLFFFAMAWGLHYTHDIKKYLRNMYLWGVGMAIGDFLLYLAVPNAYAPPTNNIFVTLFLYGIIVTIVELYKKGEKRTASLLLLALVVIQAISIPLTSLALQTGNITIKGLVTALLPNVLSCEGGIFWVALAVGIYFTKKSKKALTIFYVAFCLLSFFSMPNSFAYETMFITNYQWMMIGALPFMLLYNGKKGAGMKWLFYIFYPAHVFLLCWLGSFITFA